MTGNRAAQLIARALMALGLGVGALAVGIWVFDIRIDIPAWMWRVAIAKLTLAGALGMLITGASLLRHLRRKELGREEILAPSPVEALPRPDAPNWKPAHGSRDEAPVVRTGASRRTP